MRISTGLKAAMIPALLLGLAACSDEAETPETRDTGTSQGAETAAPPADGEETATEAPAPADTPDAPATGGDLYTAWSAVSECPALEEIVATTGLQIDGLEAGTTPEGGLRCSYGDSMNVTGPIAQIEIMTNAPVPLDEPLPEEMEAAGANGGVTPATQHGPTAWFVHTSSVPDIGLPAMCMLGASGTNVDGTPVNVMIGVGDPAESDPQSLCTLVDAVSGLR